MYIFINLFEGWGGVYIVYRVLYSIQPKTSNMYLSINFFEGGGVHCLQFIIYNSAKNREFGFKPVICIYS